MKRILRKLFLIIEPIITILLAIYLGVYKLFLSPINYLFVGFCAKTLTGWGIGFALLKLMFATSVIGLILYFGTIIYYIVKYN